MSSRKPSLAFISPLFLFPNDSGGKIRTTNILRGLNGGAFDVTLLSPATEVQIEQWALQLNQICNDFVSWKPHCRAKWKRVADLFSSLPVNVIADESQVARNTVHRALSERNFDVVVFDFVHSAVLWADELAAATVCFTHNIEAQIFERHARQSLNPIMRWIWKSQYAKMRQFEAASLKKFKKVLTVSARDARHFVREYQVQQTVTIPTGVDLDFNRWQKPPDSSREQTPSIVFVGSMDWAANIDGVRYFLREVWSLVSAEVPDAHFVIVGRNPPATLKNAARGFPAVSFTGFVDDVRPYVYKAQAFVIPLRVGGGTRIKAFEAMALGCPVVATSIGMEGLPVVAGEHFLLGDDAPGQARAIIRLLQDPALRFELSRRARAYVEERFGFHVAAQVFERACLSAMNSEAPVLRSSLTEIKV